LYYLKKVLIAHPPTALLCIALRSVLHEWPQTIWRPVEHCFGFVCQGFGVRIIRKLVGIVSWYFDYHAATLQIDLTKYLTELRHQRQTVNAHGQPLTAWLVPRCSFSFAGLRHTIAQESAYSTPPRSPNPRQTWHRKRGRKE
jgi:hypothetical protein